MTPADIAAVTRVMGPVVREFTAKVVTDALAPILARNAELEHRIMELETMPPVAGPAGPSGQKGEAGAGIASLVVSADGRLLAHMTDGRSMDAGPVPQGQKGATGERGDLGLMGPSGPAGERGEKGEPGVGIVGPQGERGLPGAAGVDGKDGAPGLNGKDGAPGLDGKDGATGLDGRDLVDDDTDPEALVSSLTGLLSKEFALLSTVAPLVTQKRIVRDADGRITRVVDEVM